MGGLCCGLGSRRARSFSGGRQFEQLGPWGLTRDDPSWATICLSSHERASALGPWSASLDSGGLVWPGAGAWVWIFGMRNGLTGRRARRQADRQTGRHRQQFPVADRGQGAGGLTSRATSWANCGLSHKLLEPGWKAVSEGSYQLCCRWRVRGKLAACWALDDGDKVQLKLARWILCAPPS